MNVVSEPQWYAHIIAEWLCVWIYCKTNGLDKDRKLQTLKKTELVVGKERKIVENIILMC
jgi:hypothetical protein